MLLIGGSPTLYEDAQDLSLQAAEIKCNMKEMGLTVLPNDMIWYTKLVL